MCWARVSGFAAVAAVLSLLPIADRAEGAVRSRKFLVFDSLLYKGKPDLAGFGLQPIRVVNEPHGSTDDAGKSMSR